MVLILALERQELADLCESKVYLVYIVSSRVPGQQGLYRKTISERTSGRDRDIEGQRQRETETITAEDLMYLVTGRENQVATEPKASVFDHFHRVTGCWR